MSVFPDSFQCVTLVDMGIILSVYRTLIFKATKFLLCPSLKCNITCGERRLFLLIPLKGTKLDESLQQTRGAWVAERELVVVVVGSNPLSLCKHNNNSSNTLLAALLMYFQAKTGIFASCVIYCGSHLHIKALISPSERVCAPLCVCLCVSEGLGGCSVITWTSRRGGISISGSGLGPEGSGVTSRPGSPCGLAGSDTERGGAL